MIPDATHLMSAWGVGLLTSLSLILAIGAQNAFVLRQGLIGRHVFWLCLLSAVSDATLIVVGVAGFGMASTLYPGLPRLMGLAGAAFLILYGARHLWTAWAGTSGQDAAEGGGSLARTLMIGAALTWLNPHVYLDTLALIGAVSTGYPTLGGKTAFAIGAVTASFLFFFSLGYGARLLQPVMARPGAWRVIDTLIWLVTWALAAGLVAQFA